MNILLVGGAVRDHLMGRHVTDRDYLVLDATEEEFQARFPRARRAGKTFPVFLLDGSEYSFPRGRDLEEDLLARDLTINSLARDAEGELHCHPRAVEDIRQRVLRPSSPSSMEDDPLRVFRAARFKAELPEFTPHPELVRAMEAASAGRLTEDLFAERVGQETRRALAAPRPGDFIRLLSSTGCLGEWFQELSRAHEVPAGPEPHHHESVLEHTAQVMDRAAELTPGDEITVWMALCHDLGKCRTPSPELPSHHGHEERGYPLALRLGKRLALPNRLVEAGREAAWLHMKGRRYGELRPGTRVDLLIRLHAKRILSNLFTLVLADTGLDFRARAAEDLSTILQVKLEEADRNKGKESGAKLRMLRCQALSA